MGAGELAADGFGEGFRGALVHTAATRTGATQQLVTTAASQATAAALLGLLLTLALSPLATRGALSDTLRDR